VVFDVGQECVESGSAVLWGSQVVVEGEGLAGLVSGAVEGGVFLSESFYELVFHFVGELAVVLGVVGIAESLGEVCQQGDVVVELGVAAEFSWWAFDGFMVGKVGEFVSDFFILEEEVDPGFGDGVLVA